MLDFQSFLKLVNDFHKQKLPFVAYRKPNENIASLIVQNDDKLHTVNDYTSSGFIFAPFDSNEKSIFISLENSSYFETQLEQLAVPVDKNILESQNDIDKKAHINLVNKAIGFIKAGTAKKVVISRKEEIELSNFSFIETFERLLQTYKNAFVYVWYHPKVGLWLGATPERLISIKDTSFKTVSLAGTQPYINTLDVIWGAKELEEQQIVTNYIESSLKPLTDTLSIAKTETIKAGNLLHLSTKIKGILKKEKNIESLIKLVHPTPAICGLPKNVAKQFILKNEHYNREFYSGFLGELNMKNETNLYVNLRCMNAEASTISLYLGGGITKDSIAENEWQETVEKSKVIKKVLRN